MCERLDNRRRCMVSVLVEMLAPYKGRVYDPCCRSAGMSQCIADFDRIAASHTEKNFC